MCGEWRGSSEICLGCFAASELKLWPHHVGPEEIHGAAPQKTQRGGRVELQTRPALHSQTSPTLKRVPKGKIFSWYGKIPFILITSKISFQLLFIYFSSQIRARCSVPLMPHSVASTGLTWRILPAHTWLRLSSQTPQLPHSQCLKLNIYIYV